MSVSRYVLLFHELPRPLDDPDAPAGSITSAAKESMTSNRQPRRTDHWDLMLEADGQLLTWEVTFALDGQRSGRVRQLPDHRIEYLDYEGPISGNRGRVSRCQAGTFRWLRRDASHLVLELDGDLVGQLELTRWSASDLAESPTDRDDSWWELLFRPS